MSVADAFKGFLPPVAEKVDANFDLVSSMNLMLPSESQLPPPVPDQNYRVSHVVKLCPREEVLRHINKTPKPEKIDAKSRRIFDIGRAFHTLVQNEWFGKWGWLQGDWECTGCHQRQLETIRPKCCKNCFKSEFFYHEPEPSHPTLGITAHLDGILVNGGKKRVLELKTTHSMQFNLVSNVNRRPQDAHRKQIQMYMFLTGIKDGIILYFNKNESTVHHFDEVYDHKIVDQMLDNLAKARDGMRKKVVPSEKICESKSCARAKQCPVREICFSK